MQGSIIALAALGLAACVPVPPTRASFGGGGGAGTVVVRNSGGDRRDDATAAIGQIRAAVTPLALGAATRRPLDLSLGWTWDWTSIGAAGRSLRHGPFIEGAWFVRQGKADGGRWRFGPTALAELHVTPEGLDEDDEPAGRGFGVAGGVIFEHVGDVRARYTYGGARGDLAIGVAARVGVRTEDGGTHAYAVLSLECRLPGVIALVVPVPN